MKAIVVDDEKRAIDNLVRMLRAHNVDIVATYTDPRTLLAQLNDVRADVAFLDIEMPFCNGVSLAEQLQKAWPDVAVVFVSAYDAYAVSAFELEATDYLLKPILPERLEQTMHRLIRLAGVDRREYPGMTICCFYQLRIVDDQGVSRHLPWRTAKTKELFAYLLHSRDRMTSRDMLIELLWPEADPDKVMGNFNTTVYQLRQTLKQANVPVQILYGSGGYQLALNGLQLDTDIWERGLDEATAPSSARKNMYKLLTVLYRGEYLQQEAYGWAESERERLRLKWLDSAQAAIVELEKEGAYGDAVQLLQSMQSGFPLLEESYITLMRLYDKLGEHNEVKRQYDKLRHTLNEDLQVEPSERASDWYKDWLNRRGHTVQ